MPQLVHTACCHVAAEIPPPCTITSFPCTPASPQMPIIFHVPSLVSLGLRPTWMMVAPFAANACSLLLSRNGILSFLLSQQCSLPPRTQIWNGGTSGSVCLLGCMIGQPRHSNWKIQWATLAQLPVSDWHWNYRFLGIMVNGLILTGG